MLEFYTGVPGSGKTYRAVDHAYNCFIDKKSKEFGKYKRLYTNINEFNFNAFNKKTDIDINLNDVQTKKISTFTLLKSVFKSPDQKSENITNDEIVDIAYKIDMDVLLESLKTLHDLYIAKASDTDLMFWANSLNLSDALFIIDEAHNIFDSENEILIWWLTYHRHLHQDIILISQNLSLFFRKYLTCGEFFYRAVPSSLRVRSGVFTYHQFISAKMYKKEHTNSFKVKFNPAVFALYSSGANTQGKKVIHKFIIIGVILLFVVIAFFKFVIPKMWGGSDSNTSSKTSNISSLNSSPNIISVAPTDFSVVCIGFDCSCLGHTFTVADLNQFAIKYKLFSSSITTLDDVTIRSYSKNEQFFKEVLNVSDSAPVIN